MQTIVDASLFLDGNHSIALETGLLPHNKPVAFGAEDAECDIGFRVVINSL